MFTSIINDRLKAVVELLENQAGFRSNYSTLDHIFLLKSIVDIYQSQNRQLYCAFIDYSKAFDSVWRAGLWYKLICTGICGKVFTVIQHMYQNIKSCVTLNGIRSNFFNSYIGVRQGENLSPMLFAIYVNDLEQYLTDKGCEHLHFGDQELSNFLKVSGTYVRRRYNSIRRLSERLATFTGLLK